MSLFDTVMRLCREGKRIEISLAAHSMSVGNRVMVRDGIWKGNLGIEKVSAEEALRQIEDAYDIFRRALPSGVGKRWSWFHAEPCSDEEILWGEDRDTACARLECIVLCHILNGSLNPESAPFRDKWFWQSERFSDLIILKEWLICSDCRL